MSNKHTPGPLRTTNCGCQIVLVKDYGARPGEEDYQIEFCPLHAAAGALRDALEYLCAEQNGPPLERHKAAWAEAIAQAEKALRQAKEDV